jgi:hypothetical protein
MDHVEVADPLTMRVVMKRLGSRPRAYFRLAGAFPSPEGARLFGVSWARGRMDFGGCWQRRKVA